MFLVNTFYLIGETLIHLTGQPVAPLAGRAKGWMGVFSLGEMFMLKSQTRANSPIVWPHAYMSLNDVLSFINKASKHNLRAIEIATELRSRDQLTVVNFVNQILPNVPQGGKDGCNE